ncbi:hypothetical protein ADICYQ_2557 [Cyclobacterium qasimii M12-11B]|uniref:Acetyl xylan esterase domain-containing protein n=3 Tax=Cyclobacterium qasimii TaxID=1350429 RepID=S7VFZ4_9BACT|nr:hypothetical protein ADICYQ_2557 [Cyclobacterium qasimii M12-11B]GEO23785.1 xylan esterase [Cyclobacterium qasimii]
MQKEMDFESLLSSYMKLIKKRLSIQNKFLGKIFFVIVLLSLSSNSNAQKELDVIKDWKGFSNAPNALYDHITDQAYGLLNERKIEVENLRSTDDWLKYQEKVKGSLKKVIGEFPARTPLNSKIVSTIEKDFYRVENILFESQPNFYVTSSLFIPSSVKEGDKVPTIVYCSGHTAQGYRGGYQQIILNLVKKGFVVFAYDPIGQGERFQYFDSVNNESIVGAVTREHAYSTAQIFLNGSSLTKYMIWDGIRAVDYLLTRNFVDGSRIGMTGRSGGGFQTAYISPFDDRIDAIAVENHITTYTRMLQSIGPREGEQNIIGMFSNKIDHADFLIAVAPKPALMITTTNDIFNIDGSKEAEEEISKMYKAYDKEDNFGRVEDLAAHSSTKKNREATYAFFQQHLDNPGDPFDEELVPLSEEELQVTPTGQVSTSFDNYESVFSLNKKEAEKLNEKLKRSRKAIEDYPAKVVEYAKQLSGYIKPGTNPKPVLTGSIRKTGYLIEKYFIKGEGDYPVPYLLFTPDASNKKAIIYLHPDGKIASSSESNEIEDVVNQGYTVLVPDLIGTGETGPGEWLGGSYFDHAYNKGLIYQIWYPSVMIGRSILGIRVSDVLRLVQVIKENDEIKEIRGIAHEQMSPVLLHAAAFEKSITHVALIKPYSSYRSIVASRFYAPQFIDNAVAGSLQYYDLPDLAAGLAPIKLLISGITDGNGKHENLSIINEDIEIIKSGFKNTGTENNLFILDNASIEDLYNFFD